MTRLEKQKRLNREIATELDKYQVVLEYGRLFLDRDKQIRDNFKWVSYVKKGCLTGGCIDLIIALLTAFISSELFNKYYVHLIVILVLTIIIYIVVIFMNAFGYLCRKIKGNGRYQGRVLGLSYQASGKSFRRQVVDAGALHAPQE